MNRNGDWQNPEITWVNWSSFGIVVFDDERIPLVIENNAPTPERLKLPGGSGKKLDIVERKTVVREIEEELGIKTSHRLDYPLYGDDKNDHSFYVYLMTPLSWISIESIVINEAEIKEVYLLTIREINELVKNQDVLPNHAEALSIYSIEYAGVPLY